MEPMNKPLMGVVIALSTCAFSVSAFGVDFVDQMGGNVQATPIFDAGLAEWMMPAAPANNGSVVSITGGLPWSMNPTGSGSGSVEMVDAPLTADLSSLGDASATFGPGGTFTVAGKLFSGPNSAFPLVWDSTNDGPILTGTLSGFSAMEPDSDDFLDVSTIIFTPTGGGLFGGGLDYQMHNQGYRLEFSTTGAQQTDGSSVFHLQDFQNDIFTIESFQWQLQIPEPGSIGLLAMGGMFLIRRRR